MTFPSYVVFADCGKSSFLSLLHAALLDTGFLTCKTAEIVKLGTTYLAILVDCDRLDERRLDGENSLHADTVGNLTHCEALLVLVTVDADHDAAVLLDSLLVTLLDTVGNCDSVAGTELVEIFLRGGKCLLCNLD